MLHIITEVLLIFKTNLFFNNFNIKIYNLFTLRELRIYIYLNKKKTCKTINLLHAK